MSNGNGSQTGRIYERAALGASEWRYRILTGIVAGLAVWMLLAVLGVPQIFGIGSDAGAIPFCIAGAALGSTRWHRIPFYASLTLLVLSLVIAYSPLIDAPALSLIRRDPLPANADAVVALSAGVTADGYLTQEGMDRILTALDLVKRGIAPRLVVTREARKARELTYTSAGDQLKLATLADAAEVISTGVVKSTHDEAVHVSSMAHARHWKRIVLVTSPFHSRRACRTFEKTGIAVSCFPSDSRDVAVRHLRFARDHLGAFALWLYETAGTLRYRQEGWL